METIAIVTLAICGMWSDLPASRAPHMPGAGSFLGQSMQNTAGRTGHEWALRMSGAPLAFEMTAVIGSKDPVVLTISSEPQSQSSGSVSKPRQE
jgi:hypothetical protein